MNDFNQQVIDEFRANDGVVGGMFEGADMILITTTGAKSGNRSTQPLVRFDLDGRRYIVASKGGAPTNPAWFHNLKANPGLTVEIGTETYEATARDLPREERDPVFEQVKAKMPGFAEYEQKTDRVIPVIELTPA